MKQLITLSLLAILLTACGESASDLKTKCSELLDEPAMSRYYEQSYIDGLRESIDGCSDNTDCLQASYDLILDKLATAETEIAIEEAMTE
jgi:uncharacterized protein